MIYLTRVSVIAADVARVWFRDCSRWWPWRSAKKWKTRLRRRRSRGRNFCRRSRKRSRSSTTAVRPNEPRRTWRGTPRRTVLSRRIRWGSLRFHCTPRIPRDALRHFSLNCNVLSNDRRNDHILPEITSSSRAHLKKRIELHRGYNRANRIDFCKVTRLQ